mmetsp:Transcript_10325/g.29461  ORF Transcript_10325/g.29461 Transcript_10325/m.29461 type:complete len:91 (+) Transcript_10325:314-586(+)
MRSAVIEPERILCASPVRWAIAASKNARTPAAAALKGHAMTVLGVETATRAAAAPSLLTAAEADRPLYQATAPGGGHRGMTAKIDIDGGK